MIHDQQKTGAFLTAIESCIEIALSREECVSYCQQVIEFASGCILESARSLAL